MQGALLQRLVFGRGGEHCDLALAVEVRAGKPSDPEVAVRVRQGTLRSSSWGPTGNTLP